MSGHCGDLTAGELSEIAIFLTHCAGRPAGARLSIQVEKLIAGHARTTGETPG